MSLLADLEERFGETESRINAVVQNLERLAPIEKSLDDAGRGLGEASRSIENLAVSTRTAIDSLNGTLDALRQAVEALRRADPARINEMIAQVGAQMEGISSQITRFESDNREFRDRLLSEVASVAGQLSEENQSTRNTITAATETSIRETSKGISNQITRFESDNREFRDRLLSEMASVAGQLSEENQSTRNTITSTTETNIRETSKVIANTAARLAGQQQEAGVCPRN